MTGTVTIFEALKKLCLSLPGTEQVSAHGHPNFKVDGKSFAIFCINHHGDMRVGLWLHAPAGDQSLYTEMKPGIYFVPPYLGSKGWLGMDLNKANDWHDVSRRVREAYENVAPSTLIAMITDKTPDHPPNRKMSPQEINPLLAKKPQGILEKLSELCGQFPETVSAQQFGNPVWKAGKKTFVCVHYHQHRLQIQFWVGVELQAMLTNDERFAIPAYVGHNGWIDLDIEDWINWAEVESLLLGSYRHFALKRMLSALPSRFRI